MKEASPCVRIAVRTVFIVKALGCEHNVEGSKNPRTTAPAEDRRRNTHEIVVQHRVPYPMGTAQGMWIAAAALSVLRALWTKQVSRHRNNRGSPP